MLLTLLSSPSSAGARTTGAGTRAGATAAPAATAPSTARRFGDGVGFVGNAVCEIGNISYHVTREALDA